MFNLFKTRVQRAEILRMKEGDLLAVFIRVPISQEKVDEIKMSFQKKLPQGVGVVVLNADLVSLKIVRQENDFRPIVK